jgi:hypothetical protein
LRFNPIYVSKLEGIGQGRGKTTFQLRMPPKFHIIGKLGWLGQVTALIGTARAPRSGVPGMDEEIESQKIQRR